jgi:dTDP-L-rhamnose 4-epimerase
VRVVDLARSVVAALGSDLEPELTFEYRAGDVRHCFADVRRARELLGFEASVDLEAGLPELAEWVASRRTEERVDEAISKLRSLGLVL